MLIAFCHPIKNAGTTLGYILRSNFGKNYAEVYSSKEIDRKDNTGQNIFTPADLAAFLKVNPKLKCISGHGVRPFCGLETVMPVQYVTFMRNPVDRYLSGMNQPHKYSTSADSAMSVEERLEKKPRLNNYQVKFLANEENLEKALDIVNNKVQFVGLVEEFDKSLLIMRQRVGFPKPLVIQYRLRNSGGRYPKKKDFSKHVIDMVIEKNSLDMALYAHVKEILFNSYVETYQGDIEKDLEDFRKTLPSFSFSTSKMFSYRVAKYFIYRRNIEPALKKKSISDVAYRSLIEYRKKMIKKWP